ncbi:MAG TPA: hypothetical protein VF438_04035 [Candidatus Paceibacterota bacterium]
MTEMFPGHESQESSGPHVEIEAAYESFVPEEFKSSPLTYFESHGTNIKQGEILYDENGTVREDPTAVKDLPVWTNTEGRELHTVGKRVNISKGKVARANDPFYEYGIMEYVQSKGLPGAKPIAKASENGAHLIVMERVPGLRWSYRKTLLKQGFTNNDVELMHKKAEAMMAELQKRFEAHGITRSWKLSDMIFDIDVEHKDLRALVPVDWERTEIVPTA